MPDPIPNLGRSRALWISGAFVVLALYYVIGFRYFAEQSQALDAPLRKVRNELTRRLGTAEAGALPTAEVLTQSMTNLQRSLRLLDKRRDDIWQRLRLPPLFHRSMADSFQRTREGKAFYNLPFYTEKDRGLNALNKLADKNHVKLEPGVAGGFPEVREQLEEPALLWAQLFLAERVLTTAIQARPTIIHRLTFLTPQVFRSGEAEESVLYRISAQLELEGTMAAIGPLVAALPLLPEEAKEWKLPVSEDQGGAIFVDQVLLRKASAKQAEVVHLNLVVCTFVARSG